MTLLFATLSVHKLIGSVGSYIGFASLIAVAILILLYFAHARETNALRERLEEAQQHIGGLEARIAQLLQAPGAAARRGPAPGSAGPFPGNAVRRIPNPATAAAAASAGPSAAVPVSGGRRPGGPAPAGPAGSGAPALASATRFVPPAPVAPAPGPGPAGLTPAAPGPAPAGLRPAAGSGLGATAAAVAARAAAAAAPGAAANGRAADAAPAGPPTIPPWVRRDAPPASAGASTAGAGRLGAERAVRRIGSGERPASSFPLLEDDRDRGSRLGGQLLPLLVAGVAIVVIIAGLIVIKSSSPKVAAPVSAAPGGGQTGAAADTKRAHTVPFNPAHVTVAVMNGTAQAGLAADVGAKLAGDGYRQGNITNAASQTELLTYVYYLKGKQAVANEVAAQHVAAALALSRKRVRPAGSVVLQSCAISAAGAPLGACRANVVVSLGQDRVSLASGAATG
ncbi:MAG: LytR C-terminal domain-containing protein [Actinomycetota bacterium]|nr:LytR C-terminal domain-containing protein [Actinomycetota bacterium]